jgi:hypothetical protein
LEDNQTEPLPPDQAWEALLSTPESEIFLNYEIEKAKQFIDNPSKQ